MQTNTIELFRNDDYICLVTACAEPSLNDKTGDMGTDPNLEEIPMDEWLEVLQEVLNEIPDDMEELPASYNANSISNYRA